MIMIGKCFSYGDAGPGPAVGRARPSLVDGRAELAGQRSVRFTLLPVFVGVRVPVPRPLA